MDKKIAICDFIDIYNSLTEFTEYPDTNFLKSLSYKIKNGETFVSILNYLNEEKIIYKILKGFIYDLKYYNSFKKCELYIDENKEDVIKLIQNRFKDVIISEGSEEKSIIITII